MADQLFPRKKPAQRAQSRIVPPLLPPPPPCITYTVHQHGAQTKSNTQHRNRYNNACSHVLHMPKPHRYRYLYIYLYRIYIYINFFGRLLEIGRFQRTNLCRLSLKIIQEFLFGWYGRKRESIKRRLLVTH